MFDHSEPFGAKVNVLNSCASFLVDATSTQATGSRQYTAPSSKMTVGSDRRPLVAAAGAGRLPARRRRGRLRERAVDPCQCHAGLTAPGRRACCSPGAGSRSSTNMAAAMITESAAAS